MLPSVGLEHLHLTDIFAERDSFGGLNRVYSTTTVVSLHRVLLLKLLSILFLLRHEANPIQILLVELVLL